MKVIVKTCKRRTQAPAEPSTQSNFSSINEEVVGFEEDDQSIMQKLTGGTKELDVISIFGMAAYNVKTLLVEIFKQATRDRSEIKEDVDIADVLRKRLIGRRCLIVLDDIWKVEAWEDLRLCFPNDENGSRVMVTTRIEEVAKHLQHRRLQVARHCKGLPLAIVMVAGIIKEKERKASLWLEVANDLSSQVLGEQGMKVIQTSYDHLEDHLKHCLLYMALFPEDYEIPVTNLLKLWMAEEFVLNVDKENMEEASSICSNDLLNKSLVMVSRRRINGDVECCTLHDVVREFCLTKLREEEYMQPTVPYNPYQHLYSKESRLCVYIQDDLVEQLDHSEYRPDKIKMLDSEETSLEFIAHPEINAWKRSNPLPLLVKLRFVRVLHLMDVKLTSSSAKAVQSLTLLRYLAVRVEDEFEFSWVSQLHDLQTLQEWKKTPKRTKSP
ncbi:PREDICTED: putative late blight resistance protein homolog R1B-12 [Nicotiana attenuata]|uniref:putative late blight resistance protein homolog R1B-12 n=1 Tax=Nicotiana attenuata TaxID=49451 RepID=UPI000904DDC9|nr:PREDICTED: putative late blight resistance protein homolog R1B-12 [Nicotiana attenuata]